MAMLLIKRNSIAKYHGKKVRILEVIGNKAYIFIPSKQKEIAVDVSKLKNIKPKPKVIN